jgi:hypothetical protein
MYSQITTSDYVPVFNCCNGTYTRNFYGIGTGISLAHLQNAIRSNHVELKCFNKKSKFSTERINSYKQVIFANLKNLNKIVPVAVLKFQSTFSSDPQAT